MKSWTDTAPRSLLTEDRTSQGYSGEWKLRLVFMSKECPLDIFNYLISMFVKTREIPCDTEVYHYVRIACWEKMRSFGRKYPEKAECFHFLSKYPPDAIFTDPTIMRKACIDYHCRIRKILYSPRALGSEKWRALGSNLQLKNIKTEGLHKSDMPEPRRIGVGYRDKGSSQPIHDRIPRWQEEALVECRKPDDLPKERIRFQSAHLAQIVNSDFKSWKVKSRERLRKLRISQESWLL